MILADTVAVVLSSNTAGILRDVSNHPVRKIAMELNKPGIHRLL
jgi:hypothetical protein